MFYGFELVHEFKFNQVLHGQAGSFTRSKELNDNVTYLFIHFGCPGLCKMTHSSFPTPKGPHWFLGLLRVTSDSLTLLTAKGSKRPPKHERSGGRLIIITGRCIFVCAMTRLKWWNVL